MWPIFMCGTMGNAHMDHWSLVVGSGWRKTRRPWKHFDKLCWIRLFKIPSILHMLSVSQSFAYVTCKVVIYRLGCPSKNWKVFLWTLKLEHHILHKTWNFIFYFTLVIQGSLRHITAIDWCMHLKDLVSRK